MFGYFYNSHIRNNVIAFGTLFNNIILKRYKIPGDINTVEKSIKVPLSYGPKEKFIRKLEATTTEIQDILPRMTFEYTAMNYDGIRKLNTVGKMYGSSIETGTTIESIIIADQGSGYTDSNPPLITIEGGDGINGAAVATVSGGKITAITVTRPGSAYKQNNPPTIIIDNRGNGAGGLETTIAVATTVITDDSEVLDWIYNPVPYNMNFQLNVMVQHAEDGTQIIEQILPYFTPEFNVVINELKSLGIKRDISIVFQDITIEDTYEGDFLDRRSLIYTISFILKGHFYGGPINQGKIIKEVIVDTHLDPKGPSRAPGDKRSHSKQTVVPDPSTAHASDDFGFTETHVEYLDVGGGPKFPKADTRGKPRKGK